MMLMSNSAEQLLQVSNKLFHAVYDSSKWNDAIVALNAILNGCGSHFSYNMASISGMCDPHYAALYKNELWAHDVLSSAIMSAQAGMIKTDEMVLSKQDFHQSILFNEWLAPQDSHSTLQIKALGKGQISGIFTICRGGSQPKFDEHDLAVAETLLPILQSAATLYHKLGQTKLDQHCQILSSMNSGLIIVDQYAQILRINPVAEQILSSERSPLLVKSKKLEASCVAKNIRLQKYIFNTGQYGQLATGQELLLPIDEHPLSMLSVFVSPLPDAQSYGLPYEQAVSLLIKKIGFDYGDDTKMRLMSLFSLSRQEATITTHLLRELSLQQAADLEHIGIATARTYLSRIFRKTHTSHQVQLLAFLVQVLR
jgi:DNA-binding CsgD family transcriptional regulator/PAS domain-containing protein